MSMDLSIYVGPYMVVSDPKWDWMPWQHLVCDGRMEAKEGGEPLILIPNTSLPCTDRQSTFERHTENEMIAIESEDIEEELDAFHRLCTPVRDAAEGIGVSTFIKWGVVPCWS